MRLKIDKTFWEPVITVEEALEGQDGVEVMDAAYYIACQDNFLRAQDELRRELGL